MPNAVIENLRAKYPQDYSDLSDEELAAKLVAKYPEYRDDVADLLGGGVVSGGHTSVGAKEPAPAEASLWEKANEPLVSLTKPLARLEAASGPAKSGLQRGARAALRGVAEMAETTTSPLGLATLPIGGALVKFGGKVGMALLRLGGAALAAPGVKHGLSEFLDGVKTGDADKIGHGLTIAATNAGILGASVAAKPRGVAETPKAAAKVVEPELAPPAVAADVPIVPREGVPVAAKVAEPVAPKPKLEDVDFVAGQPPAPDPGLGIFEKPKAPGEVVTEADLTPWTKDEIIAKRNLQELSDLLNNMRKDVGRYRSEDMRDWYGVKSPLPKELQKGWKYDDIRALIDKGLEGGKLTDRQQAYFDKLHNWAVNKVDGPVEPEDIATMLSERNLPFKSEIDVMDELRATDRAGERPLAPGEAADTSFEFGENAPREVVKPVARAPDEISRPMPDQSKGWETTTDDAIQEWIDKARWELEKYGRLHPTVADKLAGAEGELAKRASGESRGPVWVSLQGGGRALFSAKEAGLVEARLAHPKLGPKPNYIETELVKPVVQNGEIIQPNPPPHPELAKLADDQLVTMAGGKSPQQVADALKAHYDVKKPVVAREGDVEVAQTRTTADAHEITVPKGSPPSVLQHEFQHVLEAEGKAGKVPEGNKDLELATFMSEVEKGKKAAGLPEPPKVEEGVPGPFARSVDQVREGITAMGDRIKGLTERAKIALVEEPVIAETGTLAKDVRPLYREVEAKPETFSTRISEQDVRETTASLVQIAREWKAVSRELKTQAEPGSANLSKAVDALLEEVVAKWTTLRFAAGRTVKAFDLGRLPADAVAALEEAGVMLGRLRDAKQRPPIYTNIVNTLAAEFRSLAGKGPNVSPQEWARFRGDLIDAFRLNLFSVGSWTLDLVSNVAELGTQLGGAVGRDLFNAAKGDFNMPSLQGFMRAIKNRRPLPPEVAAQFERLTASGERLQGGFRKGPGTFTERSTPSSTAVDYLVGSPLYAKGLMDSGAKKWAASATIWRDAIEAANRKKLTGLDRRNFYDEFWTNVPEKTQQNAALAGRKAGFDREMTNFEESFSRNPVVKLFVEAFGRWPFQMTRAMGEWLGVNPKLFREVVSGKAKPADVAEYLGKAATGWGGLWLIEEGLYDKVDFNSMEYVHENGDRTRLSGREPVPTALFLLAWMHGDEAKATRALRYASVPFARAIILEGGLAGTFVKNLQRAHQQADLDARGVQKEITAAVNRAIPGQALLSTIKTIFDPVVREGVGANVPGVSQTLPAAVTRTTGEPYEPRQRILGAEIPAIAGVPIPGARRITDPVYGLLSHFGLLVYRGPNQPVAGMPASDIPDELRREWEVEFGKARKRLLSPLAASGNIRNLPRDSPRYEPMRKRVQALDSAAARQATAIVSRRHGGIRKLGRKPSVRERAMPEVE